MKWVLHRAIDNVERDWNYDASYLRDMSDASPRTAWLVSRMAGLLAALVVGFVLATTVAASGSDQPATVGNLAFTPKRIVASGSALVGLIGAVIGGLALARSAGRIGAGNGRRGAIVALVMGPIGLVIGGLVVATADGGLGTGNGIAGGVVAMIVGLVGIALGGLALARSRTA